MDDDCACADMLDLAALLFVTHSVALCDEASVAMVLRYKHVFQASGSCVTLASSKTNCHWQSAWAHGVQIVVTRNRWSRELRQSPWEVAVWLQQNSVYVHVEAPL